MAGALAKVQAETPERNVLEAVESAVRAVARAVVEQTQGVRALPGALVRTIRDGTAAYSIRGSLFHDHAGAAPAVVVLVERQELDPPSPQEIRAFLGLTRRQAMVANLIAAGHTNTRIAEELGISEHTARHHTESIMRKLGCNARTEVAETVLTITASGVIGNPAPAG